MSVEITKSSLGATTKLPDDLKGKDKANLNMKINKYKYFRLFITVALYPVDKDGTRENKYLSNLIDDSELAENDYEYITGNDKVEMPQLKN